MKEYRNNKGYEVKDTEEHVSLTLNLTGYYILRTWKIEAMIVYALLPWEIKIINLWLIIYIDTMIMIMLSRQLIALQDSRIE